MRNTFVKLFLALAMCFMIGSALVACGSSFELTTSPDGYIMVNGEKTDVKVVTEVASNACEEHDLVVSVVKEHTLVEEGVYLETCTLCNDYAKVINDTKHDWEEGVKEAATCYVDAFEGQVCKICGARGEGKTETGSAKHDWSKDRAIDFTESGKPACKFGGVAVRHCNDCGLIDEPRVVEAVGHVSDVWDVVKYPKVGEMGVAFGKCIYCKMVGAFETVEVEGAEGEEPVTVTKAVGMYVDLPAIYVEDEFNADNYSFEYVDGVAPTCTKDSMAIYTYKAAETKNKSDIWNSNLTFTTKEVAKQTGHFLAGQKAVKWADNGVYPYFADVNGNDKVETKETLGVNLFAGTTLMCGTKAPGYFTCTACNEVVKVDAVSVGHNGPRTVKEVAYCYAPGYDMVDCYLCQKEVKDITEVKHNYESRLVGINASGEEITSESKDKVAVSYKLVTACYAERVVEVEQEEEDTNVSAVATKVKKTIYCYEQEEYIDDIDEKLVGAMTEESVDIDVLKEIDKVDSTCYMQGYKLLQFTKDGEEGEDPIVVTAKAYDAEYGIQMHTLNGKKLSSYAVDGIAITVDIPGIMPFAGEEFKTCGEKYDAYFECSVCVAAKAAGNEDITTTFVKLVDIEKAHVFKATPIEGKEATCTAPGEQEVICTYEGCSFTGTKEDQTIPALGHKYVYKDSISGTKLELTAVCSVCAEEDGENFHKVEITKDLAAYATEENGEEVTKLSCVSRRITKHTVTLALNNFVVEVTPDNPATEDVDEATYTTYSTITLATVKDPDADVIEYVEDYTFTVTFNVQGAEAPQGHKFAEDEENLRVVKVYRDWDEDGVNDQVFEYTYNTCKTCELNELVKVELIEKLTDKTEKDIPKKD